MIYYIELEGLVALAKEAGASLHPNPALQGTIEAASLPEVLAAYSDAWGVALAPLPPEGVEATEEVVGIVREGDAYFFFGSPDAE